MPSRPRYPSMESRETAFRDPIELVIEEDSWKEWLECKKGDYRRHYYSMVADAEAALEKWFGEQPGLSPLQIGREKERHRRRMQELQEDLWAQRDEEVKEEKERRIIRFNLRDGGVDTAFIREQEEILRKIANQRAQEQAMQHDPLMGRGGTARPNNGLLFVNQHWRSR